MASKVIKDIHEYLNSNDSTGYVDSFFQQSSLALLSVIVEHIEIGKGIEITKNNAISELVNFRNEQKIDGKSELKELKKMLSDSQSTSSLELSVLSDSTLISVYTYFKASLVATLDNIELEKNKPIWVKEFEKEFQLRFYESPDVNRGKENNIIYFENMEQSEWHVKIDTDLRMIAIRNFTDIDLNDYGEKQADILSYLLSNIDKWGGIGSSNTFYKQHAVKKIVGRDFNTEFYYGEKESLNAFGNNDWSDF